VVDKFGDDDDSLPFDLFITAMAGAAAISAASAPLTGAFGGLGAIATLIGLLGPSDENQDDL
jgi:hypothetical protein